MVGEQGDGHRGEEDEADGEQSDGTKVRAEIAPRSKQRRRKKERRQKEKKNQFRIEPDLRQFGNQPEHQAADHEQDGRSEEHTSELQSLTKLVCRLLLEK